MNPRWREEARTQTQQPPEGAQQRVWQALQEPRPASLNPFVFILPAGLGLAALLALLFWPSGLETRSWETTHCAVSVRKAKASFNAARDELTLEHGQASVSVWSGPPLHILVQGHAIEVESASLLVRIAGDSVVIAPTRGSVEVDGQRLDSSEATRALAGDLGLVGLEPYDAEERQANHRAALALERGQWEAAATALGEAGQAGTLAAEAALVRKGELELRTLADPVRALSTFEALAARFPKGNLAQERELSSLEAEVALARWPAVQRRAEGFLAAWPASERTLEVRRVLAAAELQQGAQAEGCAQVRQLPRGFAPELEEACARP
jgi:hypothetical protein